MRTAQDLINECNRQDNMPFFPEVVWAILGAGMIGGIVGAMIYAYILSPFCK